MFKLILLATLFAMAYGQLGNGGLLIKTAGHHKNGGGSVILIGGHKKHEEHGHHKVVPVHVPVHVPVYVPMHESHDYGGGYGHEMHGYDQGMSDFMGQGFGHGESK